KMEQKGKGAGSQGYPPRGLGQRPNSTCAEEPAPPPRNPNSPPIGHFSEFSRRAVKGKLVGGFGLVAWPAEYGVTGIHTFMVNQDGVVYQKDIAPMPGKAPVPITRFDPDHSSEPVE